MERKGAGREKKEGRKKVFLRNESRGRKEKVFMFFTRNESRDLESETSEAYRILFDKRTKSVVKGEIFFKDSESVHTFLLREFLWGVFLSLNNTGRYST